MYRAIVIDDEKWVVKSLIATIKDQDYFEIVEELYDGISGLSYIQNSQPELAFVDVRLPGMSGLELLKAAEENGCRTLFIVISGHAEFAYAQKAMQHNAIGYCLKPFSRNELLDSMQKAYNILEKQKTEIQNTVNVPPPTDICTGIYDSVQQDRTDYAGLYGCPLLRRYLHTDTG